MKSSSSLNDLGDPCGNRMPPGCSTYRPRSHIHIRAANDRVHPYAGHMSARLGRCDSMLDTRAWPTTLLLAASRRISRKGAQNRRKGTERVRLFEMLLLSHSDVFVEMERELVNL